MKHLLKSIIAASAIALAACLPTKPPSQPTPPPPADSTPMASLAVIVKDQSGVPVPQTKVQIGQTAELTNADGYAVSTVPLASYDVIVENACCARVVTTITLTRNQDIAVTIVRPAPPVISGGESGLVTIRDLAFRNTDGSIRKWNGATDFLLFLRFLNGEDIGPVLDQRIATGVRTFRVLGMVDSFAHLHPREHASYYEKLGEFRRLINGRGVRFEFVVFADAQIIMPFPEEQEAHLERVFQVLAQDYTGPDGRGPPSAFTNFVEIANEPFKNIPGGGARAYELGRKIQGRSPNVLVASGDYDISFNDNTFKALDYQTLHDDRKPEWPRTPRGHAEVRDGAGEFRGVRVPVVGDEPTGVAEEPRGDSRTDNCDDVGFYAATAALMSGNATYHSDDGIQSVLWRPRQLACAAVFFDVMRFIPGEAQLAPYQRGGFGGGAGIGNMPIEHHDLEESADPRALRSFCKTPSEYAFCVAIRPSQPTVTPRDGWSVDRELRKGIVRLTRSGLPHR